MNKDQGRHADERESKEGEGTSPRKDPDQTKLRRQSDDRHLPKDRREYTDRTAWVQLCTTDSRRLLHIPAAFDARTVDRNDVARVAGRPVPVSSVLQAASDQTAERFEADALPCLSLLTGAEGGQRHPLSRGETTLGRALDSMVRLRDHGVSRMHCLIRSGDDGVSVEDLDSSNGTWVNGRMIRRNTPLFDGDTVQVGDVIFRFRPAGHFEAALLDSLFYSSTHDELTGAWNRSYGEIRLREEFASAVEISAHLAVVYIDLDKFKDVNEDHGHAAGDAVLIQSVKLFEDLLEEEFRMEGRQKACVDGCFGRRGGDEFMAVLPGMTAAAATDWARRACVAYGEKRFSFHSLHHGVVEDYRATVSVGVTWLMEGVRDVEEFIEQADKCCNVSKRTGRNVVTTLSSLMPGESA